MDYIKSYTEQCALTVEEIFPWDFVDDYVQKNIPVLVVDVREPNEYAHGHIQGAINVPRGILETAATFGYEDTVPELAAAKKGQVLMVCRSGKRSLWAANTMQLLGFEQVYSLKTGMRGWNDYEQALFDNDNQQVDIEAADAFFTPKISPEQLGKGWVVKNWKS